MPKAEPVAAFGKLRARRCDNGNVSTPVEPLEKASVESDVDVSVLNSLLNDDDKPRCECDHGHEFEYIPCGRKAKWRVTFICTCPDNHPRHIEILCTRCYKQAKRDGHTIEARPL